MFKTLSSLFLLATLALAVGCSSDAAADDDDDDTSTKALSCESSTAKSGDLCQLNFYCDEQSGDGPAAYCDSDGNCDCGPAADNPKKITHAGICDLEREEMANVINDECGFGL